MRTVPTRMLAAVLLTLTAGCATTPTSVGSGGVCAQWRGITWSRRDTPETAVEVKGSNARRAAWCG